MKDHRASQLTAKNPANSRDVSLDLVRGLIVALMALDHVRIYFTSSQFDPVDVDRTTLALFLTRWVTHLCAPGFFFLAGLGAALLHRQVGRPATCRFLLARGALLVALEVLVLGVAWSFHFGWWWFGVIWSLGASMLCLAGLIFLPRSLLLLVAALFTLLHNSLWPLHGVSASLDPLLYSAGPASLPGIGERMVLFPLLPWLALMTLGYCSVTWLSGAADPRGSRALAAGAVALFAFVLLHFVGIGEPAEQRLGVEATGERAFMAFLNVEKYPPSLQFSLVTLGACLLILGLLRKNPAVQSSVGLAPLLIFGRVPLFFYLVHIFVIHAAALLTAKVLGWPTEHLFWTGTGPNLVPPDGYGFGVGAIYLIWLLIIAALLPLCTRYWRLKQARASWVLKLF